MPEGFEDDYRNAIEHIQGYKLIVPEFEHVGRINQSDIRSSHNQDDDAAQMVKQAITGLLPKYHCKQEIKDNPLKQAKKKNGNGVIEVWISLEGCNI